MEKKVGWALPTTMPQGWNSELEVMRRAVTTAASHRFLIWPASPSLLTDDVFDLTEVHVDDSLIATAAPLTIENSGIDPFVETGRGPCVWACGVAVLYGVEVDVVEETFKFVFVGDGVFPKSSLPDVTFAMLLS